MYCRNLNSFFSNFYIVNKHYVKLCNTKENIHERWFQLFIKVDIFLMILGIIFPIVGLLGIINFKVALLIFILHTGALFFSTRAKANRRRIYSGVAYAFFVTGFSLLMLYGEGGEFFPLYQYFLIGIGVAVIPLIFRFRTYAITGGVLGYWLALLFGTLNNRTEFTSINELLTYISEGFLNGMSNKLFFGLFILGLCAFGISAFLILTEALNRKSTSRSSSSSSGSHYGGASYDDDYGDDDYDEYNSERRSSKSYSSRDSKGTDETNHYGWSQPSIDLDNEKKYYGDPSWSEKQDREKNDYGKPWYARDDD